MKQKNIYFYTNLLAWGLVLFLIGNYVFGWTTPSANPPSSNLPAPINVSSDTQTKTGGLNIATGDGNVGIGTTGPNGKLTIGNNVGDGFDEWSDYQLLLYTGATPQESYGLGIKSGTLAFNTNNDFDFDQDGSTVMTIDDGNVGIGTTSPGAKLDVNGSFHAKATEGDYAFTLRSDSAGRGFLAATSDYVYGSAGSRLRMSMGSGTGDTYALFQSEYLGTTARALVLQPDGGNVGIGTTSPGSAKLKISGGVLDMSSQKITNLATPTADTDAATKAYADAYSPLNWTCVTKSQLYEGVTGGCLACDAGYKLINGGCATNNISARLRVSNHQGTDWCCYKDTASYNITVSIECCK